MSVGHGCGHVGWGRLLLVPRTGPKTSGLGGWGSGVCILVDVNCVPSLLVTNRIRHMPGDRSRTERPL